MFICLSVRPSVGRLIGRSVDRSVGRSVSLSVCRSVGLSVCVCVCVSFSLSLSLHLPIHPSYSIFGVCAGRAREVTEGAAAGGVPIEGLGTIGKGQAARTAEEAGAAAVGSANVVEGLHRFSSGTIPKRKEMDLERQLQVFSQDRVTRQLCFGWKENFGKKNLETSPGSRNSRRCPMRRWSRPWRKRQRMPRWRERL